MTRSKSATAEARAAVEESTPLEVLGGDDAIGTNGAEQSAPGPVGSMADLRHALEADDRPIEPVTVPEWPGRPTFLLRGLTGEQRDDMEIAMSRVLAGTQYVFFDNAGAQMVARALVKPDGSPLASKKDLPELVQLLAGRSAGGLLRLHRAAQRLSKLTDSDIAELTDELKGDPSGDSGSN
jgi:hypothetical protein